MCSQEVLRHQGNKKVTGQAGNRQYQSYYTTILQIRQEKGEKECQIK